MKRLAVATVMLLSIFAICIVENVIIKSAYQEVCKPLDNTDNVSMAKENWDKYKYAISLFIEREKAEAISSCFSNLSIATDSEQYEFKSNINEIKDIFNSIVKTEDFSMEGIF